MEQNQSESHNHEDTKKLSFVVVFLSLFVVAIFSLAPIVQFYRVNSDQAIYGRIYRKLQWGVGLGSVNFCSVVTASIGSKGGRNNKY